MQDSVTLKLIWKIYRIWRTIIDFDPRWHLHSQRSQNIKNVWEKWVKEFVIFRVIH